MIYRHYSVFLIMLVMVMVTSMELSNVSAQAINEAGSYATVKMADNTEVIVANIRFKETVVGRWMGKVPTNISSNFYYAINNSGVEIRRSISFDKITSIEFRHDRGVMGFTVLLRDGGKILCDLPKRSITVTEANGKSESYGCSSSYIGDVVKSGGEVEGQPYTTDGFVGEATVGGEHGHWSGRFEEIRRIDFR